MSEAIETDPRADLAEVLLIQVFALDALFRRALKDARSHRDIGQALKAQARCRETVKILLALRAAAGDAKKFANSNEGTIERLKTLYIANGLPKDASPAPVRRTPRARQSWSPERRARQAAAIRTWQPWRKSTGPRTEGGKARAATNALKHGHRSRAYIERRREDRAILARSAANIALAKSLLGLGAARTRGLRAAESPGKPAPFRLSLPAVARLVRRSPMGEGGRAKAGLPTEARRAKAGHRIGIGPLASALIPSRAMDFSGNRGGPRPQGAAGGSS